ncbi:hypothetical protein MAR_013320 [Mya arenaria]|uniref:SWIM-type domain-containing protein n=1 Tax=Mya arenaria TaxID=6604 RepID=A0ABY7G3H6_MYAAR|nr:hypothetical protein MAR_013320 [Mya arenaria]
MPSSEQVQTLYGIPMRQQNLTLFKIKKNDLSKLRKKQIFWEEHSSERLPLSFDGVPFMILGREVRECCHGPDRHRAEKIKPTQTRNLGKVGAMTHHADKKVIDKIHCLVAEGVRDVAEMKRHIYSFSKTNFPLVPETSNRFYPSNKCLRNHMYSSLSLSQFSMEDQENLKQNIVKWRNEEPDDNFFFVPSPKDDEGEDFLFVCQTAWQRRLLSIYGNEICLMDATYGICKSEIALYFICVSTNIGYITVGCFILPSETIKNITRGLDVLKQWNPDWTPTFFMTDYDEKEIAAIEITFPDAVESLKESQHWQKNQRLRIWFEKQWLSASKRWVRYHRQSLTNVRVTTTNGLERQHYQLKQHYLKNYTAGTVTSLTTTVVKQYVEYNVKCLDSSRRYSEDLPRFLHNRPRLFLDHCTQRLPSAISMPVSNISVLPHQKFTVLSADSNATYLLDLSGSLPSCSCPDWKKNHLPCKHMLCILLKVPGSGWETLSEEFKNSPHLNIDMDLFSSVTRDKKQDGLMDSCCSDSPPTPKATTCQKHKVTVGVGSRCKVLASSLKSMLYLVQTASDYESIYADLMLLHSKVRALVPKESGLLRRPPRLGRKSNTCKHGLLKTRRKYRRTRLKKTTFVKGEKVPDVGCPRIVPQDTTVPIVVPDAKCLVYINPMGEPRSKCDKYRNRWTAFLRERSRRHIGQDALTHDGWEVQTVPHDKQTDGSSCGVYVIRFADLYLSGEEMDRCWTSQDIKKERLRLRLKLLSLGINAEVPLQDPSRLEVKQALDEFSESPREGLDMTARMNQTTNDVDLPDLEVPVAPVEWSSLESEQDQESIMEKHQRKGNLRQKRPKDVLSKKGQKRLQKIKEKNETLVQFLLSKEVKAYLLKIMQGKPASNLHTISTGMSQRARRAIKHSGFGPIDDDEQIDRVVEGYIGYIQELKLDTMKHIDYVFDVWVPEAIMMFYKKKGYSKAKAEEMFNKGVTRTKEEMEVIMHREFKSYRKYKPK